MNFIICLILSTLIINFHNWSLNIETIILIQLTTWSIIFLYHWSDCINIFLWLMISYNFLNLLFCFLTHKIILFFCLYQFIFYFIFVKRLKLICNHFSLIRVKCYFSFFSHVSFLVIIYLHKCFLTLDKGIVKDYIWCSASFEDLSLKQNYKS